LEACTSVNYQSWTICAASKKCEDGSVLAPSSSIIDVCAAHLSVTNLIAEQQLTLLPYTNRTPCGEKPDHSRAIKELYAQMSADVVQTVEKKHPGDAGKIRVRTSHTSVHDQLLLGSLLLQAFDEGQPGATFDKLAKRIEEVHPTMSPIFQ
jgi:hypothetical protein